MIPKQSLQIVLFLVVLSLLFLASPAAAQKACFTQQTREVAERSAKVFREPDPDYDPVLGFSRSKGPGRSSPPVDSDGLAKPFYCVANKDPSPGAGTTPKFHCSVPGIVDDHGDLVRYKVKPH